jgi:hypothetical protein
MTIMTAARPLYSPHANEHFELNQSRALRFASDRLFREFGDSNDYDRIRQLVQAAYDRLAAHARFNDHLPLLAECATRRRLMGAARS